MLYTQCRYCSRIGPLMCSGTMFPHVPLAMLGTPYGPCCPGCGGVMRSFVCSGCGTPQYLMMQGASALAPGTSPGNYAPVVQAAQGASPSTLKALFQEGAKSFVREAGTDAARLLFGGQYS